MPGKPVGSWESVPKTSEWPANSPTQGLLPPIRPAPVATAATGEAISGRFARASGHRLLSVALANYFSINRLGPVACPRPREATKIVSKRMNLSNGSRD
jgi:hypothetical protein